MENFSNWLAYIIVAVITLLGKLFMYVKNSEKFDKTYWQSFKDWWKVKTAQDLASWIGTVLVVWVVGYIVIDRPIDFSGFVGQAIASLPVSVPICAMYGFIAEMLAPAALKKIIGMFQKKLE